MPLIIAADNLNILNAAVAQALDSLDPLPLQELARRVEQAGAGLIDINPGFLPPRRHDRMAFMDVLQPGLMETVRVINQVV